MIHPTKQKYFTLVKCYYIFNVIYVLLNIFVIPYVAIEVSISNDINLFLKIYAIITAFTFGLYLLTFKISKYKYNFEDDKFHKKITIKIRNSFALIYLSLFLNLFALGVAGFIKSNIIDYPFWKLTLILISCKEIGNSWRCKKQVSR